MVECGLDINALNGRGHGVVCHAFNRDAALCLRWFNALLAAGWDPATMPDGGTSLLGRAVEFRRDSLVEGLIGARVRKFSPGMLTEQYAQTGMSADVVRIARLEPEDEPTTSMQLVESMLPSDQEDITRLFVCAVARCRLSWAHYFIERGADLGFRFPGGATPLHLLARHASFQSTHYEEVMALVFDLVRLGVDPLHTDVAGQTASQRFGQLHRGRSSSQRSGPCHDVFIFAACIGQSSAPKIVRSYILRERDRALACAVTFCKCAPIFSDQPIMKG
jgi:ankyrin repeat protein